METAGHRKLEGGRIGSCSATVELAAPPRGDIGRIGSRGRIEQGGKQGIARGKGIVHPAMVAK